jgi:DNA-binding NarL/FixJ family response regulator
VPGAAPETPIRILLAGDRRPFIEALETLLAPDTRFEIVGEAVDGEQAIELAATRSPDVVLMDASLPEERGTEAVQRITDAEPAPQVLMLRGSDLEELDTVEAHVAGASAVLGSTSSASDLLDTIQLAVRLLDRMGPPASHGRR